MEGRDEGWLKVAYVPLYNCCSDGWISVSLLLVKDRTTLSFLGVAKHWTEGLYTLGYLARYM